MAAGIFRLKMGIVHLAPSQQYGLPPPRCEPYFRTPTRPQPRINAGIAACRLLRGTYINLPYFALEPADRMSFSCISTSSAGTRACSSCQRSPLLKQGTSLGQGRSLPHAVCAGPLAQPGDRMQHPVSAYLWLQPLPPAFPNQPRMHKPSGRHCFPNAPTTPASSHDMPTVLPPRDNGDIV